MRICPYCGSDKTKMCHRNFYHPINDIFCCEQCKERFNRYQKHPRKTMTTRQTDEQILEDYCREMKIPFHEELKGFWLGLVRKAREDEPRINHWTHFYDYVEIVDDDDTMDTYYGKDYFDK